MRQGTSEDVTPDMEPGLCLGGQRMMGAGGRAGGRPKSPGGLNMRCRLGGTVGTRLGRSEMIQAFLEAGRILQVEGPGQPHQKRAEWRVSPRAVSLILSP